jgi:hypothetical protein
MKSILLLFAFKLLSFIGATLNTVGFLTFFFWEGLAPYRWHLILGGLVLIALGEFASRWLAKRMLGSEAQEIED